MRHPPLSPARAELWPLALILAACADAVAPSIPPSYDLVEDVTPPTLVSASVTPGTVDASGGPVALQFRLRVTDDLAGLSWCQFLMYSPSQAQYLNVTTSAQGAPLDVVMETTVQLPRYSESGEWRVGWLVCTDAAVNQVTLDAASPLVAGLAFTVTSEGDVTPPVIHAITVDPATVDASTGPVALTVTFDLADDLAGLQWCQLQMRSPSESQTLTATVSGGGEQSAELQTTVQLPQYAESGEWQMAWVVCTDGANNQVTAHLDPAPPFAPPTFTVLSAADVTPPVLTSLTVEPAVVDASTGPVAMTFGFHVADDLSGLAWCQVLMYSPTQGQHLNVQVTTDAAPRQAVLEATTQLPQFAEAGIWTMAWVVCTDVAGNQVTYNGSPSFPGPTFTVAQTNPAALLDDLIRRVESLRDGGVLSPGEANGLLAKLQAARRHNERQQTTPAANELRAFQNAVEALLRSRRLAPAIAGELNDRAQRIIDLL